MSIPIVLHIPHSSTFIPEDVRRRWTASDEAVTRGLLIITDAYTDELYTGFRSPLVTPVVYPVSRAVADPERFPDDADEPAAAHGYGAVLVKDLEGKPLWKSMTSEYRQHLMDEYYWPHHRRLLEQVSARLKTDGRCLIVDCHSFPEEVLPFEAPSDRPRPEICVGTDGFHTPARLAETVLGFFRAAGWEPVLNHPFAGALVPLAYYRKEPRVFSIMIEVNRRLYMDERTGAKSAGFEGMRRLLADLIRLLAAGGFE